MLRTQTGADFALYNRGGVRGTLAAGPLTVRQLHELFPFDDPVVVLQARGDQLPAILEQGAQTQARLSLSGMQVTLTRSGALIAVEGRPLQPDRLYTVATTGFLASGGDNMSTLAGLQVTQRLGFTREVVQQYLEQNPQVSPPASGRITRRDEG
jgi:2',3'-cyclic-nucleotide 2'-phosphodiesterase (5'-nucleotidase family)